MEPKREPRWSPRGSQDGAKNEKKNEVNLGSVSVSLARGKVSPRVLLRGRWGRKGRPRAKKKSAREETKRRREKQRRREEKMREAEAVLGRFSVVLGGLGGSVCMCISPGGPCASVCASACARGGSVCMRMRTYMQK